MNGRIVLDLKPEEFEIDEDGIRQTLAHFGHEETPISVVVLLDKSGSMAGDRPMHAKDAVCLAEIPVYAIAIEYGPTAPPLSGTSQQGLGSAAVDLRPLQRMTDGTGGWTSPVAAADRSKEVCLRVADELRNQYLLTYYPTHHDLDGRWRTIGLHTTRPGVTLTTRAGYYAPKPPG